MLATICRVCHAWPDKPRYGESEIIFPDAHKRWEALLRRQEIASTGQSIKIKLHSTANKVLCYVIFDLLYMYFSTKNLEC